MEGVADGRVTLVVPTYRRPLMLRTCLEAIRAQTWRDFVVLVCDNSEDHEGREIVEAMGDERFRYCGRQRNLGIFGNVMQGFRDASTEFVMEVDDDDVLYPDALEILLRPLVADRALVLAFADLDVVDSRGRVLTGRERTEFIPRSHQISEGVHRPFTALAARGLVYMVSTVLRRDALDWSEVPEESATAYDRHLGLAASRGGRAAYFVDRAVVAYRVHSDGDGIKHESRQLSGALAALLLERPHVDGPDRDVLDREIIRVRYMLARALIDEGRRREAIGRLRPLATPRALRLLLGGAVRHCLDGRLGRSWERRRQVLS